MDGAVAFLRGALRAGGQKVLARYEADETTLAVDDGNAACARLGHPVNDPAVKFVRAGENQSRAIEETADGRAAIEALAAA